MIQFEDLDLIAVIGNKLYIIVFDNQGFASKNCLRCDLSGKPECQLYACYSRKLDKHFYYEEIPKKTNPSMRRLCDEG